MIELGDLYGWKRLLFSNKLNVQRALRRHRSKRAELDSGTKQGARSPVKEDIDQESVLTSDTEGSLDLNRQTPDSSRQTLAHLPLDVAKSVQ